MRGDSPRALGEHPGPPERGPSPVHRERLIEAAGVVILGAELERVPVGPLLSTHAVHDDVRGALHADELASLGGDIDGDDARVDRVLERLIGAQQTLVAAALGHPPAAPPVPGAERAALGTPPGARVREERRGRHVGTSVDGQCHEFVSLLRVERG